MVISNEVTARVGLSGLMTEAYLLRSLNVILKLRSIWMYPSILLLCSCFFFLINSMKIMTKSLQLIPSVEITNSTSDNAQRSLILFKTTAFHGTFLSVKIHLIALAKPLSIISIP